MDFSIVDLLVDDIVVCIVGETFSPRRPEASKFRARSERSDIPGGIVRVQLKNRGRTGVVQLLHQQRSLLSV